MPKVGNPPTRRQTRSRSRLSQLKFHAKSGGPPRRQTRRYFQVCASGCTQPCPHICACGRTSRSNATVRIGFVLHSLIIGAPSSVPLPSPSFSPSAPSLPLNLLAEANQGVSYNTKQYRATQMLPMELELFTRTIGNHPGDVLQKTLFQRILS